VKSEETITWRHRYPYKIWAKCIKKTQHLSTLMTLIRFVGAKPSGEVMRRTEHMSVGNQHNYQMDFP